MPAASQADTAARCVTGRKASNRGDYCMNIRLAGALFAASLLAVPAQAADYLFSYTFNTGETITGSFTGTEASGLVTIESGISMKLNGVNFAGPLSARGSVAVAGDGTQCGVLACFVAPAVMSADPSKNNFLIANYGANGQEFGTNYFYIFPWSGSPLGHADRRLRHDRRDRAPPGKQGPVRLNR